MNDSNKKIITEHNFCIDFGTCNTVVSYSDGEKILHFEDEITQDVLLPTTIYFIEQEIKQDIDISSFQPSVHYMIGSSANDLFSSEKNSLMYFYQFKRFLGITSKSIERYKNFLEKFGFEYTTDEDTIYFYIKKFNSEDKIKLSIIDLIKLYFIGILSNIKSKFNFEKECQVSTILTCPAYFNDLQRSQLKRACESAGFIVMKLLNEPTTAAIYYINKFFEKETINNSILNIKFIIYDLGGGTIDTTVVEYHIDSNTCEVIDIDGNNSLGGIDIDNIIISNIYEKYFIDINNLKWKSKIRKCAEEIKIKLTYHSNHDIFLESVPIISGNKVVVKDSLKISYSRHIFNQLINDLVDKMIEPIKKLCKKYETTNVIFVGGPTQIPLLQNKVNVYLGSSVKTSELLDKNNINLYKTIVSQGGTLLSKLLEKKSDFSLLDIIPMNIGISDTENQMVIMIEKNSKIPLQIEKTFTTSHDCQRSIDIEVFEGTESDCKLNTFIGSYKIVGIPPLPRGSILIKLLFKISYNGILEISINGYKNSSGDNTKSFDFKLCENIRLIPSMVAKDLLKKILFTGLKKNLV